MSLFTRAHYQALARAFETTMPSQMPRNIELTLYASAIATERYILATALCRLFENDNSLFNKAEFLTACGITAPQYASLSYKQGKR